MAEDAALSYSVATVLQAVNLGHQYGYSIMEATGLPSGTVYPALGRLDRDGLIFSEWEKQPAAAQTYHPPRRYYKMTRAGRASLKAAAKQYPDLAKLAIRTEVERA